ncbi:MAG: hypothetical protein ABIA47_04345 [bacterium]
MKVSMRSPNGFCDAIKRAKCRAEYFVGRLGFFAAAAIKTRITHASVEDICEPYHMYRGVKTLRELWSVAWMTEEERSERFRVNLDVHIGQKTGKVLPFPRTATRRRSA